jgi:hypothetical protein
MNKRNGAFFTNIKSVAPYLKLPNKYASVNCYENKIPIMYEITNEGGERAS